MDFRRETLPELAADVRRGTRSAEELLGHALARIEELDDRVNAFVALDEDGAMAAARAIDACVARGERVGPLAGIPIGVKDLEEAAGFPTTRGSAVFAGQAPATAGLVWALDIVIGPDPTDLRSLPMPEASWTAALDDAHLPLAVAWSPTLGYAPLDDEVRGVCERAVRRMEELGAKVIDVDEVFPEDPVEPWLTLTSAYNLRTLEPFVGTEIWEQVDPGLAATVDWARSLSALDMVKAEDACHQLNLRLVQLFHEVRLLVTPTVAAPAPLSGEVGIINGTPDLNWVRFTYPFNLTRSPAATVCAGFTDSGLPVGLQLVGPQHGDLVVSRAAAALEQGFGLDPVAPI